MAIAALFEYQREVYLCLDEDYITTVDQLVFQLERRSIKRPRINEALGYMESAGLVRATRSQSGATGWVIK